MADSNCAASNAATLTAISNKKNDDATQPKRPAGPESKPTSRQTDS